MFALRVTENSSVRLATHTLRRTHTHTHTHTPNDTHTHTHQTTHTHTHTHTHARAHTHTGETVKDSSVWWNSARRNKLEHSGLSFARVQNHRQVVVHGDATELLQYPLLLSQERVILALMATAGTHALSDRPHGGRGRSMGRLVGEDTNTSVAWLPHAHQPGSKTRQGRTRRLPRCLRWPPTLEFGSAPQPHRTALASPCPASTSRSRIARTEHRWGGYHMRESS